MDRMTADRRMLFIGVHSSNETGGSDGDKQLPQQGMPIRGDDRENFGSHGLCRAVTDESANDRKIVSPIRAG